MMESIVRRISDLRILWEWGKLDRLDWDDLEWDLEQTGLEYVSLLTHLRHMEQEIADLPDETEVEQRLAYQQDRIDDLLRIQQQERIAHREALLQASIRETGLHRELDQVRAELARAREEAELISRLHHDDVPLFEEEGNE